MKDNSLAQLGGICSILLGVATALYSLVFVLLPAKQHLGIGAAEFLPSVATEGNTLLRTEFSRRAAAALLGLAVVPAVAAMVHHLNAGWVRWTSNLALLGFAVNAISDLLMPARFPPIAAAYVAGDAATKAALAVTWRTSLDPEGLLGFGGVGLWILVMSLLARRDNTFPNPLAYIGAALGVAMLLIPVLIFAQQSGLIDFIAGLGVILGPVWYVWLGVILRRAAA
jgi:hypothetical protein